MEYENVIVEVDGKPQLVSNGALLVTGHEPRTGKEIWRVRYRDDSSISSIVSGHGLLFVNTGGPPGGSQLWAIRQGGVGDVQTIGRKGVIPDTVRLLS